MSTFKKKYYYTFKSINNKSHTVEIWQDTSTNISAVQVIGAVDPFIVNMPSLENKLQSVRGTGADLGLFATSSLQFMDLYTVNMKEFQVRHYLDGAPNWFGYLDSELFSTDFSRQKNYSVNLTANDGFALLDRMYYVQNDGTPFTGIISQFDILKFIYSKLDLPLEYTYIGLSTTSPDFTIGDSETIFHKQFINNSNFYDEDNVAFTLREVLESILKPLGAFMFQDRGNIFITDLTSLVDSSTFSCKRYYSNLNIYIDTQSVNTLISDLAALGFASNSQNLTITHGVNKEIVKYSPYKLINIIDYNAEGDFDTSTGVTARGATNYQWSETEYSTSSTWTKYNNGKFCKLQGLDGDNTNVTDYYLDIPNYGNYYYGTSGTKSFVYTKQLPILFGSGNYKLKIELSAYPRLSNDLNNTISTQEISRIRLVTRLKIGSKKYVYSAGAPGESWVDVATNTTSDFIFPITNRTLKTGADTVIYQPLEDRWTDFKLNVVHAYDNNVDRNDFIIPIPKSQIDGNLLEFEIYGYQILDFNYVYKSIIDLRIKDVKITVVDSLGNSVEGKDVEYIGYMNKLYKNEGTNIDLIQGTNQSEFPTERGGLLKFDGSKYSFLSQWTRKSSTDIIENLLLRTIVGNYENPTTELSVKTKIPYTTVGYLTYSAYLSGKKFMITSNTTDYANNSSELTLQEIFADSLTINKSF